MPNYVSKEVLEKTEEKLKGFKSKRKEIAERLKKSASFGDLSENSEYQQAREDKEWLERRILEVEQKLREMEVKDVIESKEKISHYSSVEIKSNGKILKFILVSSEEIDLSNGKISYESPFGKSLLGKKKGDKVKIKTPEGEKNYEVVEIE